MRKADPVPPSSECLLFSYGTLLLEEVQLGLFGHRVRTTPDSLAGWRISTVRIDDPEVVALSGKTEHPILIQTDNGSDVVEGAVLHLTPAEISIADNYEVDIYRRRTVEATSGRLIEVYVYADR